MLNAIGTKLGVNVDGWTCDESVVLVDGADQRLFTFQHGHGFDLTLACTADDAEVDIPEPLVHALQLMSAQPAAVDDEDVAVAVAYLLTSGLYKLPQRAMLLDLLADHGVVDQVALDWLRPLRSDPSPLSITLNDDPKRA